MKRSLLLFVALTFSLLSHAIATSEIKGRVVDATTGDAIEYADVIVADEKGLSVTNAIVENGNFLIKEVPVQTVQVLIRIMGYEPYVSELMQLKDGGKVDLGTIRMTPLSVGLEQVTIVGEKNQIVYKLDRQVISGSSSVTAAGGTAVDILANTPSVLLDPEGGMTFRGSSNFLVYVNGKPSPLEGVAALQMIPSASVEDIEIITTPSARYKTDGDVGIINITTKKSDTAGLSGLVTASGSTLGTWSLDGTFNYRKGRNDFYVGGTFQDIHAKSEFSQQKTTVADGVETTSDSNGTRWRSNHTNQVTAGWNYADGVHNDFNLELQTGRSSAWRGGDMTYDETRKVLETGEISHNIYDSHDRYNLRKDFFQASTNYIWKINDRGDQLILQNRFRYDWFSREYTESNMFDMAGKRFEGTRGYEQEHHWDCDGSLTYKLNYSSTGVLELGYQYTTYSEHGRYKLKYWDRDQEDFYWQDPERIPFYYRRQVHSGYAMLNDQLGKLSYELGVRADRVIDKMDLSTIGRTKDIKRFNIFPSAHLSYNLGNAGTLSAGYSYRTNRPGIWNLEPYITYEDYYTKKIGNPEVVPEYSHSVELGWRKTFKDGNSLSATAYYRYRKDITDWVRTAYEAGVTLDSLVNAGNQIERGIEISAVVKPTKWWNSTLNGSFFNYRFIATSPLCTSTSGNYYMINWANTFSIAKNSKIQLDTHVVGPKILTQGKENAYYYWDLAFRQQFLKGKLTFSATAHDVFHTAKSISRRNTNSLSSYTWVRPKYPNIIFSLSYNFNASKAKSASVSGSVFEGKDF